MHSVDTKIRNFVQTIFIFHSHQKNHKLVSGPQQESISVQIQSCRKRGEDVISLASATLLSNCCMQQASWRHVLFWWQKESLSQFRAAVRETLRKCPKRLVAHSMLRWQAMVCHITENASCNVGRYSIYKNYVWRTSQFLVKMLSKSAVSGSSRFILNQNLLEITTESVRNQYKWSKMKKHGKSQGHSLWAL